MVPNSKKSGTHCKASLPVGDTLQGLVHSIFNFLYCYKALSARGLQGALIAIRNGNDFEGKKTNTFLIVVFTDV